MKISILILIFFVYASSCTNNTCDITDYKNGKWNKIDTSISYKICNTSKEKLDPNDSIQIEFLGVLKVDQKILIQTNENLSLFTLLTNLPLGKFKQKELASNVPLNKILPVITKNSECLLKFKFSELQFPETRNIINIYFKQQTDSTDILKLNKKISSLNYVDSVIYLSSDAAVKKWSGDVDSTWKSFLENNPLPSSSEIYIKKGFYNPSLNDSLTSQFSTENIISEIVFPKEITSVLSDLSKSLKFPFFIKIKSW